MSDSSISLGTSILAGKIVVIEVTCPRRHTWRKSLVSQIFSCRYCLTLAM